jgi:predicted RNA-binding protein with PUA-like domain
MIITPALCALSLRAIRANRQPHLSEAKIRDHYALCHSGVLRSSRSGLRVVKISAPSTASFDEMSEYFESQCTPKDFRDARSDRAFNNDLRRESAAKGVARA